MDSEQFNPRGRINRNFFGRRAFDRAGEIYKEQFGADDGGIIATFQVIFMLGWKQAEGQVKPLTRGSATVSFKDLETLSSEIVRGRVSPTDVPESLAGSDKDR